MTRFPMLGVLVGVLVTAGAPTASPAPSPPSSEPPRKRVDLDEPPSRPAGTTRLRMRDHFDGLREIERHLVHGRLAQARDRATSIAFDRADRELPTWAPYIARMQAAAAALSRAETIPDACRAEAQLAAECAGCHVATSAVPFIVLPPIPRDGDTLVERMARHQWAADRLWEGVVGLSDDAWRAGLGVLAATPLPSGAITTDVERQGQIKKNARGLQQQARYAASVKTPALRARAYGQLLITCSGCHTQLPEDW